MTPTIYDIDPATLRRLGQVARAARRAAIREAADGISIFEIHDEMRTAIEDELDELHPDVPMADLSDLADEILGRMARRDREVAR